MKKERAVTFDAAVDVLLVEEKLQVIPGYLYGLTQPAVLARVHLGQQAWQDRFDLLLQSGFPGSRLPNGDSPTVERVSHWCEEIQRLAGFPVFCKSRVLDLDGHANSRVVVLPSFDQMSTSLVLKWVATWANRAVKDGDSVNSPDSLRERARQLLAKLRGHAPQGTNNLRFLQAAHELNIPWFHLARNLFQLGQGARARWLDSSLTDVTPGISVGIAHNKMKTALILKRAGLPGAHHVRVGSGQDAVEAAKRFGYPVVVKPADKDGGKGVSAGLMTPDSVRRAFDGALKVSRSILLEKHFEGKDYRLVIWRGELIWAIERVPGGVAGNGIQTIRELIAEINRHPLRGQDPTLPLKWIDIDDEALSLLQESGLTLDAVPAEGRFVRLRRNSNISRGGMPLNVTGKIHPDNRLLAERAARLLRIDLAGVDLLIPDIERSWMETGALICEVNAQPQLGSMTSAHLYSEILRQLIVRDGRIPCIVVLGQDGASELSAAIENNLATLGIGVGVADASGVRVAKKALTTEVGAYADGLALMLQPEVEVAIISLRNEDFLQTGLAFDRIDLLLVTHDCVPSLTQRPLQMLLPMCHGALVADGRNSLVSHVRTVSEAYGTRFFVAPDAESLAEEACKTLVEHACLRSA